MATDAKPKDLESPSMAVAYQFWEQAKKEFESNDIIQQKDACEKAYRAATESIDVLLASRGYIVEIGTGQAHLDRAKHLTLLADLEPTIQPLRVRYSSYKDQLHGLGFYSRLNPVLFKDDFYSVEDFLKNIQDISND